MDGFVELTRDGVFVFRNVDIVVVEIVENDLTYVGRTRGSDQILRSQVGRSGASRVPTAIVEGDVRFDGSILWIESSIDTLAIGVGTVFSAIILNDGVFDVVAFGVVKKPTLISDVADAVDVAALFERSSSQRIDGARVGFCGAQFLHHEFPVVVATESIAIVFNDIAGRHEIGLVLAGQIRRSTVPRDGI